MLISGILWAKLQRSSEAPQSSGRVKYRTDRAAIQRHFTELCDVDQQAFGLAFKN
jgi:hypothetical protein